MVRCNAWFKIFISMWHDTCFGVWLWISGSNGWRRALICARRHKIFTRSKTRKEGSPKCLHSKRLRPTVPPPGWLYALSLQQKRPSHGSWGNSRGSKNHMLRSKIANAEQGNGYLKLCVFCLRSYHAQPWRQSIKTLFSAVQSNVYPIIRERAEDYSCYSHECCCKVFHSMRPWTMIHLGNFKTDKYRVNEGQVPFPILPALIQKEAKRNIQYIT